MAQKCKATGPALCPHRHKSSPWPAIEGRQLIKIAGIALGLLVVALIFWVSNQSRADPQRPSASRAPQQPLLPSQPSM